MNENDNKQQQGSSERPKLQTYHENQRARAGQWRCHPRLADFVAANLDWYSFRERWYRLKLLYVCARSEKGQEPREPFLTDPKKHRIDDSK